MTEDSNETKPICIFRMINGDELIAELMDENKKFLFLKNPLIVEELFDHNTGASNVILSSYVPFGLTESISFDRNHVMTVLPVKKPIERYYFNSLKYNTAITDKRVEEEVNNINIQMEELLIKKEEKENSIPEEIIVESKNKGLRVINGGLISPGSNTLN